METMGRLKEFFEKIFSNGERKKLIENSIIVIVIGIIIVIAGGALFDRQEDKAPVQQSLEGTTEQQVGNVMKPDEKSELEKKLEEILSKINGAGKVDVLVTYESGNELIPATDTSKKENVTQERDSGGGTRDVKSNEMESKVVFEDQGGSKKPVILKELQPGVKGVIIVAEGATDPRVKENLSKAVQVITGVAIHKVQVFERMK